jgi:hypothetical protein
MLDLKLIVWNVPEVLIALEESQLSMVYVKQANFV